MRLFFLILVATFLFIASAKAQDNMCGEYDAIERALTRAHEQVVWRGQIGNNLIVEVWGKASNPQSWSLLVKNNEGAACVKAMGDGWEALPYGQAS